MAAPSVPSADRRLLEIRHLDFPFRFEPPRTLAEWKRRRSDLVAQLRLALGVWPAPPFAPLKPHVTRTTFCDGYAIENVYFESFPGLLVTGNVYRPHPLPTQRRACPALLVPHGHWKEGRLVNRGPEDDSMPGLCINVALRGGVAFAYDMLGYNDALQIQHRFGADRVEELALSGFSILGLQTLNSIAAAGFLLARREVDPERLACTGASGGGSQTFLLAAIDERIRAAAPVVMVSGTMQGGCLCENAPLLRIGTNNIEITALIAPRPLLVVSCTGDWTADVPSHELPAIRKVYRLYGKDAARRAEGYHQHAGHNYNRASREALYGWLGRLWFGIDDPAYARERPFQAEPLKRLRVFPNDKLPACALKESALAESWTRTAIRRGPLPKTPAALLKFRGKHQPLFDELLKASAPRPETVQARLEPFASFQSKRVRGWTRVLLTRRGEGDLVQALWLQPPAPKARAPWVVLVHPYGHSACVDPVAGTPGAMAAALLQRGAHVLAVDTFEAARGLPKRPSGISHGLTYNLASVCHRVQDLLTATAWARTHKSAVHLAGQRWGGLWCVLARTQAQDLARVAADLDALDTSAPQEYLWRVSIPHLMRAGGLPAAAALCAPAPLFLHHAGAKFDLEPARAAYRAAGAQAKLKLERKLAPDASVADWLLG